MAPSTKKSVMRIFICLVYAFSVVLTLFIPFAVAAETNKDNIETYIKTNKDTLSGAAVIRIENGKNVEEYYYGYVDIEANFNVDESTVFEWASITKLLIWTSIMQLVEAGEVDLNRDVREYLPVGFLSRVFFDNPITLLNLMNHNAGWADAWQSAKTKELLSYDKSKINMDLGEALKAAEPRQIYEPGTIVAYSNYGAWLAGYIVEYVSGKPCWEYINENIFEPLGMENTTVHPIQADKPNLSARRDLVNGYYQNHNYVPNHRVYYAVYPSVSAMGTIGDMARFAAAFMPPDGACSPLFQNHDTLDYMLTPSLFFPDGTAQIAHGFWTEHRSGKTFYGHGGNEPGFSCHLRLSPETREALLIMTNTENELMLCGGLADKILGPIELPYTPEIGVGTAHDVTGIYFFARAFVDSIMGINKYFSPIIVTAKDDVTVNVFAMGEFGQLAPYIFASNNNELNIFSMIGPIHFIKDGDVYMGSVGGGGGYFIKASVAQIVGVYSLLLLLLAGAAYCIVMLISSCLCRLIKKPAPSLLRLLRNIAHAFYLIIIINTFLCVQSGANLVEYSSLIPHFIINSLALPIFALYLWFYPKFHFKISVDSNFTCQLS